MQTTGPSQKKSAQKRKKWHYENAKSRNKQNVESLAPGQECQSQHKTSNKKEQEAIQQQRRLQIYHFMAFTSSKELKERDFRTQYKGKYFFLF